MKSFVGMSHQICPVCHEKHSEQILIDKHLRESLERDTFTGYALCPEHAEIAQEYMFLIGTTGNPGTEKNTQFSGDTLQIRWHLVPEMFKNIDIARIKELGFAFCETGVVEHFRQLRAGSSDG